MRFVKQNDPWEGSFENLTVSAAKPVKKAVVEAVKITAEDVRQQIFGEKPPDPVTQQEQQKVKDEETRNLAETSRRMQEMEEKIQKLREERLRKELQVKQQEKQVSTAKATAAKKEPIWQKMMKMGSQSEKRVNAGG